MNAESDSFEISIFIKITRAVVEYTLLWNIAKLDDDFVKSWNF